MRAIAILLIFIMVSLPLAGCADQRPVCSSGHYNQFAELTNGTSGELNLTAIEDGRRDPKYAQTGEVTGVLFAVEQSEFDVDDDFVVLLDDVEYDKDELIDDGIPEEAYYIWEKETTSRCGSPYYATQFGNVSINGVDYWGIHIQDTFDYQDRENPEFESNLNVTVFVHYNRLSWST